METFIFVLHILSCIFLVSLILFQHGQGANMGAAFGGASQTVFGSRGPATFLNKLTIIVAVIFLGASIYLANIEKQEKSTSVVDEAVKTMKVEPVETFPAPEKALTPEDTANGVAVEPEGKSKETAPAETKTEEKKTD